MFFNTSPAKSGKHNKKYPDLSNCPSSHTPASMNNHQTISQCTNSCLCPSINLNILPSIHPLVYSFLPNILLSLQPPTSNILLSLQPPTSNILLSLQPPISYILILSLQPPISNILLSLHPIIPSVQLSKLPVPNIFLSVCPFTLTLSGSSTDPHSTYNTSIGLNFLTFIFRPTKVV